MAAFDLNPSFNIMKHKQFFKDSKLAGLDCVLTGLGVNRNLQISPNIVDLLCNILLIQVISEVNWV